MNKKKKNFNLINLDEVLKKRNLNLPKFIINFLKKIFYQKEINDFIIKNQDKHNFDFIDEIIKYFNLKIEVKGQENLPKNEKLIFVANHPLGGLDGIIFARTISKFFPNLKIIVNDLLFFFKNLQNIFLGVNLYGSNSKVHISKIESAFKSDKQILIFPAGLVSRRKNSIIQDLKWKHTFVKKAIQHKRNIVPVFIKAQNSNIFYNIARFREKIGIKFNVELILLPSEVFKQKDKKISLKIGKKIFYKDLEKNFSQKIWAEKIKNKVYNLNKK